MAKDSELTEFINGVYTQYGTLSKRLGTTIIGNTADDATKIKTIKSIYNIGDPKHFRISDNGKPEVYSFANQVWTPFTGTAPDGYVGTTPEFVDGTPIFDGDVKTHIVPLADSVYFLNASDQMVFWRDNQWYVYEPLDDVVTKPTVAKTGSATGSTTWFYYVTYHNDVGSTLPTPSAVIGTDSNGTGHYTGMPIELDDDTYLTVTIPTAPAGTKRVSIYRSTTANIGFWLEDVIGTSTSYVDKGLKQGDTFFGLPKMNDTGGQKFVHVDVFQDKLIGRTTEGGSQYLYWAGPPYENPANAPSFSPMWGGGYIPYRLGDGGEVRGVHAFVSSNENSLLVFKDSAFGRLTFVEGGAAIQDINIAVGSLSPESLHIAGNNFRFWSRDGASSVGHEANYGNLLRYSVLSLRADAIARQLTAKNLPDVCGVYYRNLSIFGLSTQQDPGNNVCLVYDERYNAWVLWTNIYANSFAKMISDVDKIERLYYASDRTADVLEMFSGRTDYGTTGSNGTKITLSITTKQYDMGSPDALKKIAFARFVFGNLFGSNTSVGVSYSNMRGVQTLSPRFRIPSEINSTGFGNVLWGQALMGGEESEDISAPDNSNVRFINLRQRDVFWVKFNIQNDGITDEMSLLGLYLYYSDSSRQLGHALRIRQGTV
jgi:hypothetical protein